MLLLLLLHLQAAGINIPADAAWTIFAPKNEAFSDDDIREETGLTAQQLLQPENKQALTQVGLQEVWANAAFHSCSQVVVGASHSSAVAAMPCQLVLAVDYLNAYAMPSPVC